MTVNRIGTHVPGALNERTHTRRHVPLGAASRAPDSEVLSIPSTAFLQPVRNLDAATYDLLSELFRDTQVRPDAKVAG